MNNVLLFSKFSFLEFFVFSSSHKKHISNNITIY